MPFLTRFAKLTRSMQATGLEAVALNPGPSLTYLTGLNFHLMERPVILLFTPGQDPALIVPELEKLKLQALSFPAQAFAYGENPAEWPGVFAQAMETLGLNGKPIGLEPRALRLLEYNYLTASAPAAQWRDASAPLAQLRISKDVAEVEAMRHAVKIAESALEATLPRIKIGMTEREAAAELIINLFRAGSDPELPFAPIVSSGPNSANPHASPSDRKLSAGDLLVIDWGAASGGYISDLTRTFTVGAVDAEYEKIHAIVQAANAAGRAAGKPGAACATVDKAARAVIEQAGYGEYFTHRTGHGIGMEAHEDPYMRGDNQQKLEPGMAYTVEPGIYLPGRNGVRIEDNLVITADGVECLSSLPREIRVVG
ncbi:MAG: aminopeptidase P family protein [Anaerolineae bacterium CG_4_9_14_3_um_filter_57_17]|nr:aminopeptidase P family protein [bacterium]NCT21779.1 aminopeptidase P family protein [bacterium]PJB67166.1 MAG: aminopeptidase P family protein [Anaerolineae bacterium CG_4_9_14_3_um_filter_57_17]